MLFVISEVNMNISWSFSSCADSDKYDQSWDRRTDSKNVYLLHYSYKLLAALAFTVETCFGFQFYFY